MEGINFEGCKFSKYDVICQKKEFYNPHYQSRKGYRVVDFDSKNTGFYVLENIWTQPSKAVEQLEMPKEWAEEEYEIVENVMNKFYVELMRRKFDCVLDDADARNKIRYLAMEYIYKNGHFKNAEPDPVLDYWYNIEKDKVKSDLEWFVRKRNK